MGEESVWNAVEKRGVVLRDVRFSSGSSYYELLLQTINDTNYNSQLVKTPSKPVVRISIIIEPLETKEGD